MNTNRTIEELFKDEELPEIASRAPELPRISIAGAHQAAEPQVKADSGADRRVFTRIDITQRKLELRFTNQVQFARQYIENISLGGLFVKTDLKPKMGDLVPIEFSVPSDSGARNFQLKGKVCRVSSEGVGLEFIQVPNETRIALETFVGSILPQGMTLASKSKASTVELLETIRTEKRLAKEENRRLAYKIVFIVLLAGVNLFELRSLMNEKAHEELFDKPVQSITVLGSAIEVKEIRAIESVGNNKFELQLENGKVITVRREEIENQLPYDLRQSLEVLSSFTLQPTPRRSQTSSLSQLR